MVRLLDALSDGTNPPRKYRPRTKSLDIEPQQSLLDFARKQSRRADRLQEWPRRTDAPSPSAPAAPVVARAAIPPSPSKHKSTGATQGEFDTPAMLERRRALKHDPTVSFNKARAGLSMRSSRVRASRVDDRPAPCPSVPALSPGLDCAQRVVDRDGRRLERRDRFRGVRRATEGDLSSQSQRRRRRGLPEVCGGGGEG